MKKLRLKHLACSVMAISAMSAVSVVNAQSVDSVLKLDQNKTTAARKAQERINRIADQTDKIEAEYRTILKNIQGLKVYNAQIQMQVDDQIKNLASLDQSINDAAGMERDIAPMMLDMIEGLTQFVALDLPFDKAERTERVEKLRLNLGNSNLSTAEQFRQILEAYKIETDYGKNIDTYTSTENIGGVNLDVNVLRVGRIALMYQTKDQASSGVWNNKTGSWDELGPEYKSAIADGIKIAKKQASINIMSLPIVAPEAAQ